MTEKPRVLLFDIECTNLAANFGYILSVAWKWSGRWRSGVKCLDITQSPHFKRNPTDDSWLVENFRHIVEDADIIIGHYSTKFDYPFLQARALYHQQPLFPTDIKHIDTWRIARQKLKLNSNRLSSLAAHLGLEEKTPLSGPIWIRAMAGHVPSIRYVVAHNKQDVVVLEQCYDKIKGLNWDNPKVSVDKGSCPTCGSFNIRLRGFRRTTRAKVQRFSCNSCGHWSCLPQSPER